MMMMMMQRSIGHSRKRPASPLDQYGNGGNGDGVDGDGVDGDGVDGDGDGGA